MSDAADIARIQVDAWRAAYRGQMPEALLDSLDVEARECVWTRVISEAGQVLVARSGLHIFGFCDFGASRDADRQPQTAELYSLYVHPTRWNQGLGSLLLQTALDAATQRGFTEMTCWVLHKNQPALAFYARHSFHPDGGQKTEAVKGGELRETRLRRTLA